jgi:hypothetical protein
MLSLLRGWKVIVGFSVVFLVVLYLNSQIKEAKEMINLQNKIERQEDYIDGRKGIDNATKNVRGLNGDAALEWLRDRVPRSSD